MTGRVTGRHGGRQAGGQAGSCSPARGGVCGRAPLDSLLGDRWAAPRLKVCLSGLDQLYAHACTCPAPQAGFHCPLRTHAPEQQLKSKSAAGDHAKMFVDEWIDACAAVINLRTAIMRYRKPRSNARFHRQAAGPACYLGSQNRYSFGACIGPGPVVLNHVVGRSCTLIVHAGSLCPCVRWSAESASQP